MRVIHKPDIREGFTLPERWTATSIKVLKEWLTINAPNWTPVFHIEIGLILTNKTNSDRTFVVNFGRVVYVFPDREDVVGECSQSYINKEFDKVVN